MHCIQTLEPAEWGKYLEHLVRLDPEDRRLRFGYAVDDVTIRAYVRGLDPRAHRLIVHLDDNGRVVGAVHLAPSGGNVEFGVSVDSAWRGQGLGRQLFERAVLWARNRGLRKAHVYCLTDNRAMRHIARTAGMEIELEAGESAGALALVPATPFSLLREMTAERWALYERSRRQPPLPWQALFHAYPAG